MKILLVEDDVNLALGVEYALKNEGSDTSVASTVAKARELLTGSYDLALLDVMLSKYNQHDQHEHYRPHL